MDGGNVVNVQSFFKNVNLQLATKNSKIFVTNCKTIQSTTLNLTKTKRWNHSKYMASKNKQILMKTKVSKQTFTYQQGNVNMTFTWNTDIKSELKDALVCLEAAAQDVKDLLINIK